MPVLATKSGMASPTMYEAHSMASRSLRVEFDGQSYRWFDIDEMVEVHGASLIDQLIDGIAQYFQVPSACQVLCDIEGPILCAADLRRTMLSMAPRLWVFDVRTMTMDLRVQCEQCIEDLGLLSPANLSSPMTGRCMSPSRTGQPGLLPWVVNWRQADVANVVPQLPPNGSPLSVSSLAASPPAATRPQGMPVQQVGAAPLGVLPVPLSPTRVAASSHSDRLTGASCTARERLLSPSRAATPPEYPFPPLDHPWHSSSSATTELRRHRLEYPGMSKASNGLGSASRISANTSATDLRQARASSSGRSGMVPALSPESWSGVGNEQRWRSTSSAAGRRTQSPDRDQPRPGAGGPGSTPLGRRTIEVVLTKTTGQAQPFGFTNVPDVATDGYRCLRISQVSASGLLALWNARFPSKSLSVGDRIVSVNGVSDDLVQMRELLCGPAVRILAEKALFDEDSASSLMLAAEASPSGGRLAERDARAESLQQQIQRAEERMASEREQVASALREKPAGRADSVRSWQFQLRGELLERERRIQQLEQQLKLWQGSEAKGAQVKSQEVRTGAWHSYEERTDDGSVDGDTHLKASHPMGRSPSGHAFANGSASSSASPEISRADREALRQHLQRKVERVMEQDGLLDSEGAPSVVVVAAAARPKSAPEQAAGERLPLEQSPKDREDLQQRLDSQAEDMASWKKALVQTEAQVAELVQDRQKHEEATAAAQQVPEQMVAIRFPTAAWPAHPQFEAELCKGLAALGATCLGQVMVRLRGGSVVAELLGPRSAIEELCGLPLFRLDVLGHLAGGISRVNDLAAQPEPEQPEENEPTQFFSISSPAVTQAPGMVSAAADSTHSHPQKPPGPRLSVIQPELAEQQAMLAAQAALHEELRGRELAIRAEAAERQQAFQQLEQQMDMQMKMEMEMERRKLQMATEEMRALALERDRALEHMKVSESKVASAQEQIQRQQAQEEQEYTQLRALQAAQVAAQELRHEAQEQQRVAVEAQMRIQELQVERDNEKKYLQELQRLHQEESRVLAVEREAARMQEEEQRRQMKEIQDAQALQATAAMDQAQQAELMRNHAEQEEMRVRHEELTRKHAEQQEMIRKHAQEVEELRNHAAAAQAIVASETQEAALRAERMQQLADQKAAEHRIALEAQEQQRLVHEEELRKQKDHHSLTLQELEAQNFALQQQIELMKAAAAAPAPAPLPAALPEPEMPEEMPYPVADAAPPDYVATGDDALDIKLAEEIAAMGPGILRGNLLTRTAEGKYKLGTKKLVMRLTENEVRVRLQGAFVPLKEWLEVELGPVQDGGEADEDLTAAMFAASPYAQHGG